MYFYALFYNITLADSGLFKPIFYPIPKDPQLTYLKLSIDNSILKLLSAKNHIYESPKIEATFSNYPKPIDRFVKNTDVSFYFGSYTAVVTPLLTFSVLLITIVREKD